MQKSADNFKQYNNILTGILKFLHKNANVANRCQKLLSFLGLNLNVKRIFLFIQIDNSCNSIIEQWPDNDTEKILPIEKQENLQALLSKNKPHIINKSDAEKIFTGLSTDCVSISLLPLRTKKKLFGYMITENTNKSLNWSKELLNTMMTGMNQVAIFLQNSEIINEIHNRNEQLNDALEEIKEMRSHLVHSERLASVGELSRGIAHEINNPMTGILNYAELIKSELPLNTELHHYISGIIEEGTRISQIVNDLLTFSYHNVTQFFPVQPSQLFNSCLSLIRYLLIKDGITIEKKFPDNLPCVYVIEQQIRQVIINLISNARYALNQKHKNYSENKILRLNAYQTNYKGKPYIRFEVYDTGTGIPSSDIKKIFDPFFSTKRPNLGTGLGLSIAYNITIQNKGFLSVESVENEFTRFMLDLPQLTSREKMS